MGGDAVGETRERARGAGALPAATAGGERRHRECLFVWNKEPDGGAGAVLLRYESGG